MSYEEPNGFISTKMVYSLRIEVNKAVQKYRDAEYDKSIDCLYELLAANPYLDAIPNEMWRTYASAMFMHSVGMIDRGF